MRHLIIFLAFLFSLVCSGQDLIKDIDQYMIKARQDWQVPGMAIAIVKDGEVILSRGYGIKKSGENARVDKHTLFAIASNTKAFTSAALSILVEQNMINWSDKVKTLLPDFELYDHYTTEETTIKDLLCHRVGLGTYSGDLMWYKSKLNAQQLIPKLKYVPQKFDFRDGYGYSNLMFIAAGEVIKVASGKPWNVFIDSVFFKPLGMHETVTSTSALLNKENVATPHKPFQDGNQPIEWVNWDNMGSAGAIISNVDEMAKWLIMQLNAGVFEEDTLIHPDQHQYMWSVQNPRMLSKYDQGIVPGRTYKGYGLGWNVSDYRKRTLIEHGGGYDGMYSKVMMVPEENLGIVILTNSMKGISNPLCYYIIDRFLMADLFDWSTFALDYQGSGSSDRIEILKEGRQKKTKPTAQLSDYAGTYYSEMHGEVVIEEEDGNLTLEFINSPSLDANLTHWHFDTWEIQWEETHAWFDFGLLQFQFDINHHVSGLHFDVPNYDIFFDEVDLVKTK